MICLAIKSYSFIYPDTLLSLLDFNWQLDTIRQNPKLKAKLIG